MLYSIEGGATSASKAKPSRRLFLAAGSAATVFATVKSAAALSDENIETRLIELAGEVIRLSAVAADIGDKRIAPFQDRFEDLIHEKTVAIAFAFSRECGREQAIEDQAAVDVQADHLFNRMMAIPATTQPGRAAKVRALLLHVMGSEWRGDAHNLDWEKEQARALLAEFAEMSAQEIANV